MLELRAKGRRLSGSFPYDSPATMNSSGKVRKERVAPGAFRWSVSGGGKDRDINLLVGHNFDAPLASRAAGSLRLRDTDSALEFDAALPAPKDQPSWMRDALLAIRAGLMSGVSPGFVVDPRRGSESLDPEPGNSDVYIRTILDARLLELSVVTRPAYSSTRLDLRGAFWPEAGRVTSDSSEFALGGVGETARTGAETGLSGAELGALAWLL